MTGVWCLCVFLICWVSYCQLQGFSDIKHTGVSLHLPRHSLWSQEQDKLRHIFLTWFWVEQRYRHTCLSMNHRQFFFSSLSNIPPFCRFLYITLYSSFTFTFHSHHVHYTQVYVLQRPHGFLMGAPPHFKKHCSRSAVFKVWGAPPLGGARELQGRRSVRQKITRKRRVKWHLHTFGCLWRPTSPTSPKRL